MLEYEGELTGHDFLHEMGTILHEKGFNLAWVETLLTHIDKNANRDMYNHVQYVDGHREMM